MNINFNNPEQVIWGIFYLMVIMDVLIFFFVMLKKKKFIKMKNIKEKYDELFIENMNDFSDFKKMNKKLVFLKYVQLKQHSMINYETDKYLIKYIQENNLEKKYFKQLNSLINIRRVEAANYLSYLPTINVETALKQRLAKEKSYKVKLYICYALLKMNAYFSIPSIINTLHNAPKDYQKRIWSLLSDFDEKMFEYFETYKKYEEIEIKSFLIYFASVYVADELKNYLIDRVKEDNKEISHQAVDSLQKLYFYELDKEFYLKNDDPYIRNAAVKALENIKSRENIEKLISYLDDEETKRSAVSSISNILKSEMKYFNYIISQFYKAERENIKDGLASVISIKTDFIILKILSKEKQKNLNLLKTLSEFGKNNDIIDFLNKNSNKELEDEILTVIKVVCEKNEKIKNEYCMYLKEELLSKIEYDKLEIVQEKRTEKLERGKSIFLFVVLFFAIFTMPVLHYIKYHDTFNLSPEMLSKVLGQDITVENYESTKIFEQLKIFVIDFNYYLIYYSVALNMIYIILLIFSVINSNIQRRDWKVKEESRELMFKKNILPSISLIAPAYNEEQTIIESITSLLKLSYPEYEMIVVNDGSKDQTLNKLIRHFNLKKVEGYIEQNINTKPIRGIYMNKDMPNFKVIDKENGGKADALNVGINVSTKEYFCGMDADSLLDADALLKSASRVLDWDKKEVVAIGGNIFPANGCVVNKGYIEKIKLPKDTIPKFQAVEYIRAFTVGRIGWSFINSLLIISGAFGLFKKDRIVEIGGYLTSSSKLKKDTVGEDMELVVRLAEIMKNNKIKFKIDYFYNAICWTEVPDNFKVLSRQRDRWHRGLIDIIYFHRQILFNPKYRELGLIAMPYFFLFEFIGPLIEFQGYLMVLLAILLGIINYTMAMLLFLATIFFGVLVSLFSLLISDFVFENISFKDILRLYSISVIENFGYRQISSFFRLTGFISSMKKPKGWGHMPRKGFSPQVQTILK